MKHIFLISALIFLIFSCLSCDYLKRNNVDEDVVARVGDKFLLKSDIEDILPGLENMSDSAEVVNNYIKSWVNRQILINEAEEYLKDRNIDFSRQLQDYRNSLLIYTYENEKVGESMDTIVSNEEMIKYYEINKEKFVLNEPVFKGFYARMEKDSVKTARKKLNKFNMQGSTLNYDNLEIYLSNSASDYFINSSEFTPLYNIYVKLPFESGTLDALSSKRGLIEYNDDDYVYYTYIDEAVSVGQIMPFDMAIQTIKNTILRTRRFEFVDSLNKSLYDRALKKKDVEFY